MPGAGKRQWDYFKPGQDVAGVEITARLNDELIQERVIYDVVWLCCGRRDDLSHYQIKRRLARERVECLDCSRASCARAMGEANSQSPEYRAMRAAQARARAAGAVYVESGPWRGSHRMISPLGPRWSGIGSSRK